MAITSAIDWACGEYCTGVSGGRDRAAAARRPRTWAWGVVEHQNLRPWVVEVAGVARADVGQTRGLQPRPGLLAQSGPTDSVEHQHPVVPRPGPGRHRVG